MIIFLYGEDNFRSRLKLNELKVKYLKEVDKLGSGLKTLDGAKATFADIAEAIGPASLLSKKRLIIIENIFANKQAKIFEDLLAYLKKGEASNGNIIIFWESYLKSKKVKNAIQPLLMNADGREKPLNKASTALFKFLAGQKYSHRSFDLLSNTELVNWIKKETVKRGGKISAAAASILAALVGSDGWQISNEIDKLINFKAAARLTDASVEISAEDVKTLVRGKFSDNIFSLTDAISAKNKALAIKLLGELADSGLDGHYLLTMFIRQFKILLQIREALDAGLSQRQIAGLLKLHPFVLQKGISQAGNFSLAALKNIFNRLVEIDYSVKSGRGDCLTNLNMLVAKI